MSASALLLVFDLLGTIVFALNGALTAIRVARLDLVGVVTLGIITAIGGGIMRDLLIGDVPPASFRLWYYLAVATVGGLIAFWLGHHMHRRRFRIPILVLDAAGLSLFAVTGAAKALAFGLGWMPAVLMGVLTAVGGGTLRDMMVRKVPTVLHSELYVIPALIGASVVVLAAGLGWPEGPFALFGAGLCFAVRLVGLRFNLNAPRPHDQTN